MRKILNLSIVILIMVFLCFAVMDVYPQSSNKLSRRCPGASPNPANALVEVQLDGDVNVVPCSGRSFLFNGSSLTGILSSLNGLTAATQLFAAPTANDTASWSSVTATHTLRLPITAVSGSSRTNYFPFFSAANTFAKSPFSWDGTKFLLNNTALNSESTFEFTPSLTGCTKFGDYTTTSTTYFSLCNNTNNIVLRATNQLDFGVSGDNIFGRIDQSNGIIAFYNLDQSQYFFWDTVNEDFFVKTEHSIVLNSMTGSFRAGDLGGAGNSTALEVNDIDNTVAIQGKFQLSIQTPASASETCATGQISWGTSFIYVCTASNTWKRAAIATW
jgi:hypothetical protein